MTDTAALLAAGCSPCEAVALELRLPMLRAIGAADQQEAVCRREFARYLLARRAALAYEPTTWV